MKALKIVGIVLGILLLLTGGGLAVGSIAASKGQAVVDQELANRAMPALSTGRCSLSIRPTR